MALIVAGQLCATIVLREFSRRKYACCDQQSFVLGKCWRAYRGLDHAAVSEVNNYSFLSLSKHLNRDGIVTARTGLAFPVELKIESFPES